jgi:GNAT superfamily N-acetyltransferase
VRIGRYLPGRFSLSRGTIRDYDALASFHYVAPRPATIAGIWVMRYRDGPPGKSRARARPVAVGVLSYPVPSSAGREWYLRREDFTRTQNLRFANRHIRTISRVIVHPQFRSLGLSTLLVRTMCQKATTRYVEAFAHMGRAHPLFVRAGMTRIEFANEPDRPVYFIFDRKEKKR